MKKKEDSSFQLLFTALVLVVIAIGGTLAWFASNSTSSVNQIAASLTAPTDSDSFDGSVIQYWSESGFVNYGEGDGLYVPGMRKLFRVAVTPNVSQAVLFVLNGTNSGTPKPTLGNAMKIRFYNSKPYTGSDGSNGSWKTDTLTSTVNTPVSPDTGAFSTYGWTVTHPIPQDNSSDYIYFVLGMDTQAQIDPYEGTRFDFQVGVVNPGGQ